MGQITGTIRDVPGAARPADLAQRIAVVGWFSGLDYTIPQIATVQQSGNVKGVANYGKGSDLAAFMLRDAESQNASATLYLVPHPPTITGSITFGSQTGFGPAATLTATGDHPHDDAEVRVKVTITGGPGVGKFQIATAYSVTRDADGGAPQIAPLYEASRVMPPRVAAMLTGNVDLTGLVYALPATVTGSVDIVNATAIYGSAGTLAGKEFDITIDGGSIVTVTFGSGSAAPTSYLDVLSTIEAAISPSGSASVSGLGRLVLTGSAVSSGGSIVLAAGTPDALALLGLTAATTNGTAGALDGLTIQYQGDATGGAQTYTFPTAGSALASADAVAADLTAETGVDASLYSAKNWLRIGSSTAGSASTFQINGGTALTPLGLAVDSAVGSESEFVVPHLGVKVTFVAGTYTIGYERTWTVKAPAPSVTDISNAIDALVAQEVYFGRVVVAAEIPLLDIAAAIQAADSKIGELEVMNDARFTHALLMAPLDESDTDVRLQYTSVETRRVDIACRVEYVRPAVSSPNNAGALKRSQGWTAAAHYAAYSLGDDVGQHEVNGAPAPARLVDYVPVDESNAVVRMALHRDDTADNRALVLERWANGYHFAAGYTLAATTSAYADQYVRDIILRVAQLIHAALRPFLNLPRLPLTSQGRLTDEGASSIAASCMTMLGGLLPAPDAGSSLRTPSLLDGATVAVDQTEIIGGTGGTQRLTVDVVVQTKGVARKIRYTAGAGLIEVP